MYSQKDYLRERAICDKADSYAERFKRKNGWTVILAEAAKHPDYANCNNAMRGRVKQFEILRDLPNKIVAYCSSDESEVTTWSGDFLGTIRPGKRWRSNMGDQRFSFQVQIGKGLYSGLGFGGGMYCRLKKLDARKNLS